jgi:nicrotizing toxin Mtb-like protein
MVMTETMRGTGKPLAVLWAVSVGLWATGGVAGATAATPAASVAKGLAAAKAATTSKAPARLTTCSTAAFAGEPRLGPRRLPNAGPVARLLRGWKRLAGFSPRGYLKLFYDRVAKSWRYPPQGGYQLTPLGVPVVGQVALIEGQLVDRFGSEGGTYLSPQGTPYAARGIPPESLNPFPGGQPCNYYRYRVLKPFSVNAGPIAPALGQPGFGLQYVLSNTLFTGVTERVDVTYLLSNGYVARVPYVPLKAPVTPVRIGA